MANEEIFNNQYSSIELDKQFAIPVSQVEH